jgi:hypothetical protein
MMPYVLSFEVHKCYEIHFASVGDAMVCYDQIYRLIGPWLDWHEPSAGLRCTVTGRLLSCIQASPRWTLAAIWGAAIQWSSVDARVIQLWVMQRLGKA